VKNGIPKKIEMNLEKLYVCIEMAVSYEKNKKHIMKWRENNPTKWRELNNAQKRKSFHWKKIKLEFLNILIDEYIESSTSQSQQP
jgi:inactivated superfamily I helicase